MSVSIMISLLSPLKAFTVGRTGSARDFTATKPNALSSPPIAAAAVATGYACGKSNYRSWPTKPVFALPSPITQSGTSKWNRIEHRMFSFINISWRGKPLLSHKVIVQLIASTKTKTGLNIGCDIEWDKYPKASRSPRQT